VWREEERRQAIEREREKAAKVVSIDELNVRPEGGQRQIRRSVKDEHHHRAKVVSEGRETLRREGVLLVRAIDEFKGKMLLTPDAVSSKKRKQLKFKLNDIIRVTAGTFRVSCVSCACAVCRLVCVVCVVCVVCRVRVPCRV
jgi:hypothetical protein